MTALHAPHKDAPATASALRAQAAGRAAARQQRIAERRQRLNPPVPTLISENFLSEFEFARAISRDIRTIRRWRSLRQGPAWVKVGRSIFYSKAEILRYLDRLRCH